MTSNRFFIRKRDIHSASVRVCGSEHHHLRKVARIKIKQNVWLFDECGTTYLARVENIDEEGTRLTILKEIFEKEPRVKVTLAQALVKSKSMELILQKAVELGTSIFIPVVTARSVVRIKEKEEKKIKRWKRIALSAAKQSGRPFLTEILPPHELREITRDRKEEKRLFMSEQHGVYLKDILLFSSDSPKTPKKPPSDVILLVGPEGGWTDEEEQDILSHGFLAVSLGDKILRSETAAISSLAMISHFWNV